MDYKHTQKFVLVAPRKLRPVASAVKKLAPQKAVETIPFLGKSSSEVLVKVIKAAIANAVSLGQSPDNLKFKEIQITEGPRLKRGRPVSRGRWHPYMRKMSHIRVVLTTKEVKSTKKQEEKDKKTTGKKVVENKVKKESKKKGK